MTRLVLSATVRREIESQAEADYPRETCGLLLGREGPEDAEALRIIYLLNAERADPFHRYSVNHADYQAAEATAAEAGLAILGVYHSHPDSPPIPSTIDAEFAFPGWIYAIQEVAKGNAAKLRVWRRADGDDSQGWSELEIATVMG